jgi:hypothetical protein
MADTCPTMRVKHKTLGSVIINKSDFDPSIHEPYETERARLKSEKSAKSGKSERTRIRMKKDEAEEKKAADYHEPDTSTNLK